MPNRNEKEPMRQIYMYYKKLKQCITKLQNANGGSKTSNTGSLTAARS
jgi:hypothetical protein